MAYASTPSTDHRRTSGNYLAAPVPQSYWSATQLSSFTFLMSGYGLPVCSSMMLGDIAYAREQLRLACTLDDHALQQLAVDMLSNFTHMRSAAHAAVQWTH